MKSNLRSWLQAGPLAILLAVGLTSPVLGQNVTATIKGSVEDKSGAILKDASVTAVNQKTQVEYPTKSNDAGIYTIQGLPIGIYTVKAEAPGMKTLQTNPITLEVGQIANIPLRLEVGAKAEEIEVIGVNPVLQTENATVGEVVTGSTAVALPLNGRNFAQLALLLPGVQTHSPDTFNTVKQNTDSGRPYINGQREQANNYIIDGLDANEAVDNTIAYYPSPDAIAEMKIETNNYSAEFGNVAGGIISTVLKSGTNEFHGSAFEFARNHKFDANTYGNKLAGAGKTDFKQNIFGATLSGPLVKNKLFFFADYQGQTDDNPGDQTATVLPASERVGVTNPIVANILNDTVNYPLPTNGNTVSNYVHFGNSVTRNHQGDLKLDANLGPQDNIFIRGSYGHYDTHTETPVYPLAFGNQFISKAGSAAFNWNHAFSSSTVNELRIGFSHVENNDEPADPAGVGSYDATIGLPVVNVIPGLPQLNIGSNYTLGTPGVGHDGIGNTYQLSEKLSMSMGKHYLSVGGQIIHYNMDQLYSTNSGFLGHMNFDTPALFREGITSQKGVLLGTGTNSSISNWVQRQNRIGLFVQDDFKPSSNLTLNLGLRWEYASPITEKDNRQANWDQATGAEILPGGAFGNALYDAYYGGFSPRVGFAWTANPKTVVRGGFGMVQYMEGTGANCRLPINPPYEVEVTKTYTGTIDTGYNDLGTPSAQDPSALQLRAWQTDLRPQLTKQWNVFVERQLSDATSLNIGYVGSRASHVITFNDNNFFVDGFGSPRRLPNLGIMRYTASNGTINYDGLQASLRHRMAHGLEFLASYTFSNSLTDNQGFYGPGWGGRAANVNTAGFNHGDGNYNPYDLHLDYGPAWFSAKHDASLSLNYQLPIGKGRSVGSDWSGVTQALLGGWNVSGILQVRSGLPVTVVNGWGEFGFTRPDLVPGADPKASNPTRDGWLNAAAFVPNAGNFGNSPSGVTRGPGYWNLDAGVDKNFDLGGSRFITLRVEAFNVFNHTNLGLPDRTLSGFNADGTPGNSNFGKITETANGQRVLELAAKFVF